MAGLAGAQMGGAMTDLAHWRAWLIGHLRDQHHVDVFRGDRFADLKALHDLVHEMGDETASDAPRRQPMVRT